SPHGPQLSHRPRWRSHQRGARRCRLQLQPAPALVRGAFTRPLVDPLPRPLGRPASPNRCRKTFFTADSTVTTAPAAHPQNQAAELQALYRQPLLWHLEADGNPLTPFAYPPEAANKASVG